MAIIAKTIPPKMNLGYWNSGLFGGCADLFGRAMGNISFTIYSKFNGVISQPFFTYIVDSVVILLTIVAILFRYKRYCHHIEIEISK